MNKRIEELAKVAGYSGGFDDPQEIEQIGNDFSYFDIEKFAELIVQDCCAKLVEMGQGWIDFAQHPPQGQEHNVSGALFAASRLREDAVYEIKEHFGVNK